MDAIDYEQFLERIRLSLDEDSRVLGLIVLGSTAVPEIRDPWSDHDIWIITESANRDHYLESIEWLPDHEQILLTARHGAAYRTVVYSDRHKIDYAVLDVPGLASGTIELYRVLIDRGQIQAQAQAALERTRKDRIEVLRHSYTLQNLGILVWTAFGRAERGELLSARFFLELAADVLLNLLCVHTSLGRMPTVDSLDPRRRLERNRPKLAHELLAILQNETVPACRQLLLLAERELRDRAPNLGWEEIDQVKSWIGQYGDGT
jgi:hypothetical protein